jgi:GT2 family glycosyltransferase
MELALMSKDTEGIKLSIIIVCFNSREVLLPCLDSIWNAPPSFPFEVILVDNGSRDDSVQEVRRRFDEVIIIQSASNAGYAGGNNIGFAKARGQYVLFLNPDTIIHQGALDAMLRRADADPNISIVGPSIQQADGTGQLACFRAPSIGESLAKAFWLHHVSVYTKAYGFPGGYRENQYKNEMEVEAVSGCCLLARKATLDEVGVFDEEYFVYFEDSDLCERVRKHGYKIFYDPSASIVHLEQTTTRKYEIWCKIQAARNECRFFSKHRGRWHVYVIGAIQLINWIMRVLLGSMVLAGSGGRAKSVAHRVYVASKLLLWRFGIEKQGQRP